MAVWSLHADASLTGHLGVQLIVVQDEFSRCVLFAGVAALPPSASRELLARQRHSRQRMMGQGGGMGGMGGGMGAAGPQEGPNAPHWLPSCAELLKPEVARGALRQAMRFSEERLVHARKKKPDYVRVQPWAPPGVHVFLRFLAEEAQRGREHREAERRRAERMQRMRGDGGVTSARGPSPLWGEAATSSGLSSMLPAREHAEGEGQGGSGPATLGSAMLGTGGGGGGSGMPSSSGPPSP